MEVEVARRLARRLVVMEAGVEVLLRSMLGEEVAAEVDLKQKEEVMEEAEARRLMVLGEQAVRIEVVKEEGVEVQHLRIRLRLDLAIVVVVEAEGLQLTLRSLSGAVGEALHFLLEGGQALGSRRCVSLQMEAAHRICQTAEMVIRQSVPSLVLEAEEDLDWSG